MKRKLLLCLALCMVLSLMPTTLAYAVEGGTGTPEEPVVPTAASYVSNGTYVSGIDYTCVDGSATDLTGSVECNYMETRTGFPSEGRIRLEQSYYLNVPTSSAAVTVELNLSEAAAGMKLDLDDAYSYNHEDNEYNYDPSYNFDVSTNTLTLDWNGYDTSFMFNLEDYTEIVSINIYSERPISADNECRVTVRNPLEGLSTDVPASGQTEAIQFYSFAVANNTVDFDNITYSFARGDSESATGIDLDANTGIMTLVESVEPGLVVVTATYETTGTTGYEYLVISDTAKYGYTSYVSYSDENDSNNRGRLSDCLVTLTKEDGTVQTGTSLSDGFVWINNITDYDGDVTITGAKTGYQLDSTNNYTAYQCSTTSYVSMVIPEVVDELFSGGAGTSKAPYLISSVADLKELADRVNGANDYTADAFSGKYFTLTAYLDLTSIPSWEPIGYQVVDEYLNEISIPFSGIFDGGDHSISKLKIDSFSSYQGLFGYVDGGTIKNLSVTDAVISANGTAEAVGGIVGSIVNGASIDNCDFSGIVSGYSGVGGIVGNIGNSQSEISITNCENKGSVIGNVNIGGIVGNVSGLTSITNCINSGTTTGETDNIGGIVGCGQEVTVTACSNSGTVNGNEDAKYVGGIAGYGSDTLTIEYCYNTGWVSYQSSASVDYNLIYIGGIVGHNDGGKVSSCFNLGKISGFGDSSYAGNAGGIVGLNNGGEVEYCYNTGYVAAVSSGGIASNNSGTVQYCYNTGDLDYWDNAGHIAAKNTGTVQECYYDTQMIWYSSDIIGAIGDDANGTTNNAEGKTTANMLGDLFGDTTHWTTDTNLYPRIADPSDVAVDMDTTDVAYVSVAPVRFVGGESITKVTKDFTVCTDNGVSWTSQDTDLISITGSNATVLKGDYVNYRWGINLTASLNNASRTVYYVNPYSDDAGITSILSESITAGSEAGTSADPLTASINVANSVSDVSATDIVGATESTVVFYGTDSTFTTVEAGSVALTAGNSTTVYIKVTAQDGVTVAYYAVEITRAAAGSTYSNFLITQSSPDDGGTATSYYYVYAGNSETSLSPFAGSNADSVSNTAYSTVDKAITDINASAASSAMLNFVATGNTLENTSGTLNTGDGTIILTSGTYTIKGGVKTTQIQDDNGLFKLEGASVVIDGATIESNYHGIMNLGDGSVTVNSGTIITEGSAIYIQSESSGNVTVNGGEMSSNGSSCGHAMNFQGSGDLTITGGKLCSSYDTAVYYVGAGGLIISGDLWDDIAQTGTLLSSDANNLILNALHIGSNVTSVEIKGGTLLSKGVAVYAYSDTTISGGLIRSTSGSMPALFTGSLNVTVTGGTITSNNSNANVDITDPDNTKLPGTIFLANSGTDTTAKLYISGGTITNTATTGYAIANFCFMSGLDSCVYLSGTPSMTADTATVYLYNNIYANDGNGMYYSGSPVSLYYSESIVPDTTVAVSGVSAATNASLFSLINEGYLLQLSGTDLIIEQVSGSSLLSILSQSITAGSEAGTSADPLTASINVANSVSDVSATDIVGATESTVVFYGTDSTFTTAEAGSVALTAGNSTTVYIKVTAQDGVTVAYYAVEITRAAAATSSDSNLTTVLSKDVSTEGVGGTAAFPITTAISVVNSVSAVSATDIVGATDSTVVFYGTDSTFTTVEAGSVALTAGNSTTVYIKVTAQDGVTVAYYAVEITRASAVSSSSGSSSGDSKSSDSSGTDVLVNGVAQSAGTETTETVDGKTKSTIDVDEDVLSEKIAETIANNGTDGTEQNTVEVVISDTDSDESAVQLNGEIINNMEDNDFDLNVTKGDVSYSIPASEFAIDAVAEQMDISQEDLADIEVEITIGEPSEEAIAVYEAVVETMSDELIIPPVSFTITAHTTYADGTTGSYKIDSYNTYVPRVFAIPEGVDPSKITTGIVFNSDGTYEHVPTEVFEENDIWYAKINSLTNSTYSVIWNPIEVSSVSGHWSEEAVNDMASRLVIFDPESFEPDKVIIRADFAEYIVRALGLYREDSTYENKFSDVEADGDRTLAIQIAYEYGIIAGYPDGTFRPDELITREEAMTMYQRAMNITKLEGTDEDRYQSYTDYEQVGSWAVLYVQEVLSAHVFNGTTESTISPRANLTYAEAAQAIKNLLVESKLINE